METKVIADPLSSASCVRMLNVQSVCTRTHAHARAHTHTHTHMLLIKRMHGITEFRPDSACTLKKSASAMRDQSQVREIWRFLTHRLEGTVNHNLHINLVTKMEVA
jgi:hypothetical protein